jgi:hypothetical protein
LRSSAAWNCDTCSSMGSRPARMQPVYQPGATAGTRSRSSQCVRSIPQHLPANGRGSPSRSQSITLTAAGYARSWVRGSAVRLGWASMPSAGLAESCRTPLDRTRRGADLRIRGYLARENARWRSPIRSVNGARIFQPPPTRSTR